MTLNEMQPITGRLSRGRALRIANVAEHCVDFLTDAALFGVYAGLTGTGALTERLSGLLGLAWSPKRRTRRVVLARGKAGR